MKLAGNRSALRRVTIETNAHFMWDVQQILEASYTSDEAIGQIREVLQAAQKRLSDAVLAFQGKEQGE